MPIPPNPSFSSIDSTDLAGVRGGFLAGLLAAAPGILQGVSGIIGAAKSGGGAQQAAAPAQQAGAGQSAEQMTAAPSSGPPPRASADGGSSSGGPAILIEGPWGRISVG